jgi:hypothetical protein
MGLGFRFKNKVDGVNGIVVLMKRDEMANVLAQGYHSFLLFNIYEKTHWCQDTSNYFTQTKGKYPLLSGHSVI